MLTVTESKLKISVLSDKTLKVGGKPNFSPGRRSGQKKLCKSNEQIKLKKDNDVCNMKPYNKTRSHTKS